MGFVDYVVEYFRGPQGGPGPAGADGAAGAAGPALDVTDQDVTFPVHADSESVVEVDAPSGKYIHGAVLIGDTSALAGLTKTIDAGSSVTFSCSHTSGDPVTVKLLLFVSDATPL